MESSSPIQPIGVNSFPSIFWNRTGSLRSFRALIEERANENRVMTKVLLYVKQQAASAFRLFKRIKKVIHLGKG